MHFQTITDDYRRLNRDLHESGEDYGIFGWRYAQKVMDLRDEYECETVLDYGCGKSTLKEALGHPDWLREYDPAIPGKDGRPEIADLLVCTDVLEHIEPELLDNVLLDMIRVTRKVAFVVIATRESIKLLPDGTSPHKIVRPPEWWKNKLSEKCIVLDWEPIGDGEVQALISPIRPVGEIRAKSAVSDTIRFENAERNCKVVAERVANKDMAPRHDGRVCVVGFGPSLQQTWRTLIVERKQFGAKIVTVSGAHDFLISKGVIPDYHVEVDPREHKCFFTRNPHPDVTYWIASCCHPKLIDNLVSHNSKLFLWHLLNSDNDFKIAAPNGPDPGSLFICGGSGVGARSVNLFVVQGYRTVSLYGMDCSFADDGSQHAGEHSGKKKTEWKVRVGDRWFRSSSQMIYMARSMIDQIRVINRECRARGEPTIPDSATDHVEFFFNGDNLLSALVAENNRLGEVPQ